MPNPGDEHAAGDVPEEALGPDDLRRLADLLERPTRYGAKTAREGMRACASAWEADRKMLEASGRILEGAFDRIKAHWWEVWDALLVTFARIGALERLLAHERGCDECWRGVSCGVDCHMNDVAALAAHGPEVLSGEEEP
jgi:hypothetical protein